MSTQRKSRKMDVTDEKSIHDKDPMYLPPRRVIHPSGKGKLVRYYVHSLIVLFVLLVFALILWGMNVTGDWGR